MNVINLFIEQINTTDIPPVTSETAHMGDEIKVLGVETRYDPQGGGLRGRDGFAYDVLYNGERREIFMSSESGSWKNYYDNSLSFVKTGYERENFYTVLSPERWSEEEVTKEIREALKAFDELPRSEQKRIQAEAYRPSGQTQNVISEEPRLH